MSLPKKVTITEEQYQSLLREEDDKLILRPDIAPGEDPTDKAKKEVKNAINAGARINKVAVQFSGNQIGEVKSFTMRDIRESRGRALRDREIQRYTLREFVHQINQR